MVSMNSSTAALCTFPNSAASGEAIPGNRPGRTIFLGRRLKAGSSAYRRHRKPVPTTLANG